MRKALSKSVQHITPVGKSVFTDLFLSEEAVEMQIRSVLMEGLQKWFKRSGLTQVAAANLLNVSQARISDITRGKLSAFSLDLLIKLASRAGLHPHLKLKKAA